MSYGYHAYDFFLKKIRFTLEILINKESSLRAKKNNYNLFLKHILF